MILLYHERKMEQLNSIFWHRCLLPDFASSHHLSIRTWLRYLRRGGGTKKRFQYCLDPYSGETILYLRAFQGHSGGQLINPTLQDNVLLPSDFAEYINHVGSSHDMHSIIQSGLIPGGKDFKKKGTDGVFFTAVNPMSIHLHKQRITTRRSPELQCANKIWKIHQKTVYWANIEVALKKGLTFVQT